MYKKYIMRDIIHFLRKLEVTSSTLEKKRILAEMMFTPGVKNILNRVYNNEQYHLSMRSFENMFGKGDYEDAGQLVYHNIKGISECTWQWVDTVLFPQIKASSGNKLLQLTKDMLSKLDPEHGKWVARILNKDLRIGVQIKLINNVLEEIGQEIIYVHEVQLAEKLDAITDWDTFPVFVGTKYDGMRCEVEKKQDKVTLTSRQGEDIAPYLPELVNYFKTIHHDFMIDGEVMAKDFNTLQKRIGRKAENLEPVEGLYFRAFDMLSFAGLSHEHLPQKARTENLNLSFKETELFKFEEVWLVKDKEHLLRLWATHMENKEEGIMIKLLDKPYVRGTRSWVKVKKVVESCFEVVGWESGSGRLSKTTGKILVQDRNGVVKSSVGSGLTDDMREYILELYKDNQLIGKRVEVAYNEITKDSKGKKSLRHPRFLKFRDDILIADDLSEKEDQGLLAFF